MEKNKRRSGAKVMLALIGLIKPLVPVMIVAVIIGSLGNLCAVFVTAAGAMAVIEKSSALFGLLIAAAVFRGIFHYVEQYSNHYIAFRILAMIRHKVFAAMRRLAPAKLDGKDKGNLISVITSDIELLEVFYAHTVSPIAIAVITSAAVLWFVGSYSMLAASLLLLGYIFVGILIPLANGKRGNAVGVEYRAEIGNLNSFVLDSIRGIEETMQYSHGEKRKSELLEKSHNLEPSKMLLSEYEAHQRAVTGLTIILTSASVLVAEAIMYMNGSVGFEEAVICTVTTMSSFGPVTALSNLSNNLNQTLASGERVLSLLEEEPVVAEIPGDSEGISFDGAALENVNFSYDNKKVLDDMSMAFETGKIYGIFGESGSGKSTILKLLMRFWDADSGKVKVSGEDVRDIRTKQLRSWQGDVTQETWLFRDTIENNIRIGNLNASREEVIEAAKKASIHEFIMSLPGGYDAKVSELGDNLSGGQRQRIGIARSFLSDRPFILLDEPTSNLDALNEGIILKSISEIDDRTAVLVSHRKSTLNIADKIYEMKKEINLPQNI